MNTQVRELYEEIIYRRKFPPRDEAEIVKATLAGRGLGNSGIMVEKVVAVYRQSAEGVLDDFINRVVSSAPSLGVTNIEEIREAVGDVHNRVFTNAAGALSQEFGDGEYKRMAVDMLEERRGPVLEHLHRDLNIRWREKNAGQVGVIKKEREQKFGILLSAAQAKTDFEAYSSEAGEFGNSVAVLFLDIDHFKVLNQRWTETTVDQTILTEAQKLLVRLVQGRGEAYRHGGEEFLVMMPNLDTSEARAFAEKVREIFERHPFRVNGETQKITFSIGVALWPENGTTYDEVLAAANKAEARAKQVRNTVKVAGEQ